MSRFITPARERPVLDYNHCIDFQRGFCKRPICSYLHKFDLQLMKRHIKFCRNFQYPTGCHRRICKFLHAPFEDEELFQSLNIFPLALIERYIFTHTDSEFYRFIVEYIAPTLKPWGIACPVGPLPAQIWLASLPPPPQIIYDFHRRVAEARLPVPIILISYSNITMPRNVPTDPYIPPHMFTGASSPWIYPVPCVSNGGIPTPVEYVVDNVYPNMQHSPAPISDEDLPPMFAHNVVNDSPIPSPPLINCAASSGMSSPIPIQPRLRYTKIRAHQSPPTSHISNTSSEYGSCSCSICSICVSSSAPEPSVRFTAIRPSSPTTPQAPVLRRKIRTFFEHLAPAAPIDGPGPSRMTPAQYYPLRARTNPLPIRFPAITPASPTPPLPDVASPNQVVISPEASRRRSPQNQLSHGNEQGKEMLSPKSSGSRKESGTERPAAKDAYTSPRASDRKRRMRRMRRRRRAAAKRPDLEYDTDSDN
ncbi:unnamed protein product [Chrysodeixis includens]|uniref:Uncharacterized protein n=1 Tax=Chrysodeixis includens TaxID=689277 RepID=A0A9P0BKT3_CHRIL|nr:unnamed protein product [Chrysodeixis includens]